jgi:predicted transcriptional regulator
MKKHLAIFSPEAAKQILEGKKTIELRLSQKKIAPFGEVSIGDLVYIKPAGREIVGQFRVKKVISIEGVEKEDLEEIQSKYGSSVSLGGQSPDRKFFTSHSSAKYGTVIFVSSVEQFITSPVKISKSDLRGWAVLD